MWRVLSIAHSYSVTLNRRLAQEMARAGSGRWEVTAVGTAAEARARQLCDPPVQMTKLAEILASTRTPASRI